jgi:4-aminobutyrate aminotransferase-like enzyme
MAGVAFNMNDAAKDQGARYVAAVLNKARNRGVLLLRGGATGETFRMLPPLVIDRAVLRESLSIVGSVVDEVLNEPTR